jgi:hypothetical protein
MATTTLNIPTQELPVWMRQARRGLDWGILMVVFFGLTAAWAFIVNPGLPHTNATENYVYRTAEYAVALQEGYLYPRWSPHALNGYGAPIPNYYPPGAPYTAALIHDDPIIGVRIVYIVSLIMAGAMVYAFVTRWQGAACGLLASVLYVYSPYIGLDAPHLSGDLAGVMASFLIPALLWSVTRLLQLNRPFDFTISTLLFVALLLTHLQAAAVAFLLAMMLSVWHWRTTKSKSRVLLILASCALAICLSAFFWLPALLEHDLVRWLPPAISNVPQEITISGLLSLPRQIDLAELIPAPQLTLGFAIIGMTILSLIALTLTRKWTDFHMLFMSLGLLLCALAVLLMPRELWLMSVMTLCFAVGGSGVLYLRVWMGRYGHLLLPSTLVVTLVASFSIWLSPQLPTDFGDTSPLTEIRYEQQGYGVAVLPPGTPIPVTIPDNVQPSRFLLNGYLEGVINKIPPNQLSADTQASLKEHATQTDRFQITTNNLTTLNVLTAYFPGWQAHVNNRPISLTPARNTGLITVTIPQTAQGDLVIELGSTPVRDTAWQISGAALLLLGFITARRLRRTSENPFSHLLLPVAEARLSGVVLACMMVIVWSSAMSLFPFSLHARPGHALDSSLALEIRSDVGLEALAYRLERDVYQPQATIDLTVFWRTIRFLPVNYQVQISLRDEQQGTHWNRTEFRHPGNYPTRRWNTSQYVTDHYQIRLSNTIVPGEYQIAVEVYACNPECDLDTRLHFFENNGNLIGQVLLLPSTITVVPPS